MLKKERNDLVVEILESNFSLTVLGFDEKRDLFVNVKMEEGPDDSQI